MRDIDTDAEPTRVHAGAPVSWLRGVPVKVSGYLTQLVYYRSGQAKWMAYVGTRVEVRFHPNGGTCRFTYANPATKSAVTTLTGYFAKKVTAITQDGRWDAFNREPTKRPLMRAFSRVKRGLRRGPVGAGGDPISVSSADPHCSTFWLRPGTSRRQRLRRRARDPAVQSIAGASSPETSGGTCTCGDTR
jgi:hypothetical protein